MKSTTDVIVCGAGIAGISAAYHLAVQHGIRDVLLVDERPPLSLTSDKSTECYRNWWPTESMAALMNRSIDLMEGLADESGNAFHLNRRGYLYVTADSTSIPALQSGAEAVARLAGGTARIHRGVVDDPAYLPSSFNGYAKNLDGADLITDPGLIQKLFPYLSTQTTAVLHARRAGWFSAQQLGVYLLDQATACGARIVKARLERIDLHRDKIQAVRLSDGQTIATGSFVNAAGPYLNLVSRMMGIDLPVFCELHLKTAFHDHLGVVPRDAPVLIWNDPQSLPWTEEERSLLSEEESSRLLLERLPSGAHLRPEGGADSPVVLMLWEYAGRPVDPNLPPAWPPPLDPFFPEVVLRGLAAMLPGLRAYFGRIPRLFLDGGYYTKTQENMPLIGPLPVEGAYVIGALSGYGLMSACAAGELLAAHLCQAPLPSYAPAFRLERYQDPEYRRMLASPKESGQL